MRSGNGSPAAAEPDTLEQQLRRELVSQRGVITRLRQEAADAVEAAEAAEAQAAAAERDWQVRLGLPSMCCKVITACCQFDKRRLSRITLYYCHLAAVHRATDALRRHRYRTQLGSAARQNVLTLERLVCLLHPAGAAGRQGQRGSGAATAALHACDARRGVRPPRQPCCYVIAGNIAGNIAGKYSREHIHSIYIPLLPGRAARVPA